VGKVTANSENLVMACFFFFLSRGVNGLWQLPKIVGYPFGAQVAQAILTAKCLGTDVAVLN
jgi:hypothetical protein